MKTIAALFLMCLLFNRSVAQQKHIYSQVNPSQWSIPRTDTLDYSLSQYEGHMALLLKRKIGNYKSASIAYPKNLAFKDGVIEADMAWSGKQGGYLGIAFRIKDEHHYEVVYFRPESSGTINAVQYMPEKKAQFNWWDYEADKYQAGAILPLHNWFHIKLIVKGNTVTVFVNDQPKPAMTYSNLDASLSQGSVGYWLGNTEGAFFRDLTVTSF